MTALKTTPLTEKFGVEILDLDLNDVTETHLFPEIREAFENHTALLFRNQNISPEQHIALSKLFGPLEDRKADEHGKGEAGFTVPEVSNVKADGSVTGEMDEHTLNLKSNFLWHVDSSFLPAPAIMNILICHTPAIDGGNTELATTREAWADMPEAMKAKIRGKKITHRYSHSRQKVCGDMAQNSLFTKWSDKQHGSVWTNPKNGKEALYIASHACAIDGVEGPESQALIDELTEFCTQARYVYSHKWQAGDVLLWDQRAALHRGTPWNYDQPRHLTAICSTVTEADGLPA